MTTAIQELITSLELLLIQTRREAMANAVGAWNSRAAHAAARPDTQP